MVCYEVSSSQIFTCYPSVFFFFPSLRQQDQDYRVVTAGYG